MVLYIRSLNHKIHFQAQMVRRVKSYLKNMKIVTDYKMKDYEEKLHQMSIECEAPVGGIPPAIHSLGQHSVRLEQNDSKKE